MPQQESYQFQVNIQGDGILFEMSPDGTLRNMMEVICTNFLDDYRNGDGGIDDHLWDFQKTELEKPDFVRKAEEEDDDGGWDDDDDYDDGDDDDNSENEDEKPWTEDQRAEYFDYLHARDENDEALPTDIPIRDFTWWKVGVGARVRYDYGTTTNFEVLFVKKQEYNLADGIELPRIVPDEADELAEKFIPFQPAEGSPNANDLFPHANRMMFQLGSKWMCLYPYSPTTGGYVEGQGGDSDLVFLIEKFETLEHALIAINRAAEEYPQERGYARMVFPIELSMKTNTYYDELGALVNEYLDFQKTFDRSTLYGPRGMNFEVIQGLSQNIQYRLFCPQTEVLYRLTKDDVNKHKSESTTAIDQIFPLCARAYQKGMWASYHRGKVKVCTGNDTGERGIPKKILAQVSHDVTSLHEYLCVCEALFQRIDTNEKYQVLQKTLTSGLINGKN